MAFSWREYEPFHLKFSMGLFSRERVDLPAGAVMLSNAYDTSVAMLFGGKNKTYDMPEIVRQVRKVADKEGLAPGFYVTPTWEDAQAAPRQLEACGLKRKYLVNWYHKPIVPMAEPELLSFQETFEPQEFEQVYQEAFGGNGWEAWRGGNPSAVEARMLFARDVDDKLVGFGGMAWEGHIGCLFSLGIAKDERRKGYGTLISQMRMARLAAAGVTDVVTGVVSLNEASVAMREPLGFKVLAQVEWWE